MRAKCTIGCRKVNRPPTTKGVNDMADEDQFEVPSGYVVIYVDRKRPTRDGLKPEKAPLFVPDKPDDN